jgi:hypothetical protein
MEGGKHTHTRAGQVGTGGIQQPENLSTPKPLRGQGLGVILLQKESDLQKDPGPLGSQRPIRRL